MKRLLLVTSLCATCFGGCAYLAEFLRDAFLEPTLAFRTLLLNDITLGGLTLDTVWDLRNPNQVGVSIDSIDYALFIEDQQVVAGAPPKGLQVPPNGSSELHFPANVKFQDLAGVLQTFLTKDNARYRVQGSIGIQSPIGPLRFPLVKDGQFEVPKVPAVVFGNPRVSNLTFAGVTIEFPLTVTNRNTYALPITGVSGAVSLAGQNIGTLSTGDLGPMQGKATRQLSLPLQVNFLSAGMAVANALRANDAKVQFSANVQSGTQSVPLMVDQLVQLLH